MDIRAHNRLAWDRQVERGNQWTIPVSPAAIAAARQGEWQIWLTPLKPVPRSWLRTCWSSSDPAGHDILCLASGGGQQGPILAAAGARVTVLDNSPRQLAQDRLVAERESLALITVEGDMADLSAFADESFDLIVHPVSNSFVPDVRPVWREAFRVLRPGGALLSGFGNPLLYLFDEDLARRTGVLQVVHALPYSDLASLSEDEKERYAREGSPFEFSHTLEDQIGGQTDAGFVIAGFYEDRYGPGERYPLNPFTAIFIATRAVKPGTAAPAEPAPAESRAI